MTRHQRLRAAVRGEPVDRVPVCCWMHFGSEHLPPERTAWLHESFQNAYDWDWIKVMADYRFATPDDVLAFDRAEDLDRLAPPGAEADCFRKQFACVASLQERLGDRVPIFDSGYDPHQQLLRHIGRDRGPRIWRHADRLLGFLDALCDATCAHIEALKRLGVVGYFHATNGATPAGRHRGVPDEVFERFVRPFDLRILRTAQGMVRVLHAHGSGIELARLRDYPFEVIHLSDRDPDNPGLAELMRWTTACVMGGVDERDFTGASLATLAGQVDDAIAQSGGRRFMLAPGCALPSSSSAGSMRFLRRRAARLPPADMTFDAPARSPGPRRA